MTTAVVTVPRGALLAIREFSAHPGDRAPLENIFIGYNHESQVLTLCATDTHVLGLLDVPNRYTMGSRVKRNPLTRKLEDVEQQFIAKATASFDLVLPIRALQPLLSYAHATDCITLTITDAVNVVAEVGAMSLRVEAYHGKQPYPNFRKPLEHFTPEPVTMLPFNASYLNRVAAAAAHLGIEGARFDITASRMKAKDFAGKDIDQAGMVKGTFGKALPYFTALVMPMVITGDDNRDYHHHG